jgi:hypothetical protein
VDDVAVPTAIKRQGAFHVAFATVHRRSRRPQMSAIARPKRLTTSEGGTSSRTHAEDSSAAESGDLLKVLMPANVRPQRGTNQMSKSLLEQLPNIVAADKRQAAQILEQLEGHRQ